MSYTLPNTTNCWHCLSPFGWTRQCAVSYSEKAVRRKFHLSISTSIQKPGSVCYTQNINYSMQSETPNRVVTTSQVPLAKGPVCISEAEWTTWIFSLIKGVPLPLLILKLRDLKMQKEILRKHQNTHLIIRERVRLQKGRHDGPNPILMASAEMGRKRDVLHEPLTAPADHLWIHLNFVFNHSFTLSKITFQIHLLYLDCGPCYGIAGDNVSRREDVLVRGKSEFGVRFPNRAGIRQILVPFKFLPHLRHYSPLPHLNPVRRHAHPSVAGRTRMPHLCRIQVS